jgi:hypothetical protein
MPSLGLRQFCPNKEQNDRADDRQDETGGMKGRTRCRLGKQPADKSADDRATDTEYCSHYETEMLYTRHNAACDQTNDEADNDVRNDV